MYEINDIVYANENKPLIKIKSVKANDDFTLTISFSNGEIKKFNAANLISQGVFTPLQNIVLFKQAYVDYGTVVWNDNLDICPDYLYNNSY